MNLFGQEHIKKNKSFIKDYKLLFVLMDLMLIIAFVCNVGAVVLTNALVVKVSPTPVVFAEANPVAAKVHNLEQHPQWLDMMWMVIKNGLLFAVIAVAYLFFRSNCTNQVMLYVGLFAISYIFIVLTMDFANNFGYWLGRLMKC